MTKRVLVLASLPLLLAGCLSANPPAGGETGARTGEEPRSAGKPIETSLEPGTLPPLRLGAQFQGPAAPAGGYGLKRHPALPPGPMPGPGRMMVYKVKRWVPGDAAGYRTLIKRLGFAGRELDLGRGNLRTEMADGRSTAFVVRNGTFSYLDDKRRIPEAQLLELNKRIDSKAAE